MVEPNSNVHILDETTRVPSEEEVAEYAEFLGVDPRHEPHLMWIAREGVVAPVPPPWKACTENGDDIFYFNFETGESVWDHPCDAKYRRMVEQHREVMPSSVADETKLDEAILADDANGSRSIEAVGGADAKPEKASTDAGSTRNRLELITREISDDESDGDGIAVDVLDVEATEREPEGAEAVKALCHLADRHQEKGASADQKEALERALAIHERIPGADRGLLLDILRGLAEAHGALGESEAERKVITRIASLNGFAGGGPKKEAPPDRGLAGVGLAPVGLAPRITITEAEVAESDDDPPDTSASSVAGQRGAKGIKGRGAGEGLLRPAPLQLEGQLELSGQSGHSGGKNSSVMSEISEDLALELESSLSPGASQQGVLGGRATPLEDTLELSATFDVSADAARLDACTAEVAVRQLLGGKAEAGAAASSTAAPATADKRCLEGEVKALGRALAMLREIREKQREYLRLLEAVL